MIELPAGWEVSRLADIAEVRLGRQRSPKNATGDRMRPYLRAANVKWTGLDLSDLNEMAFTEAEAETYELRRGDLLLGEASGSPSEVGKPGQYKGEVDGCCFQNTLLRVRLPDGLLPDFYEYYFREQAFNGKFAAGSRGVGIHHLGAAALSNWRVPVPPQTEQMRIVTAIEEAFSKLDAGEAGLRTVRQLVKRMREAVLAAAVTGRLVRVSGDIASDDATLESLREASIALMRAGRRRRGTTAADIPVPGVDLPPSWRWVRWSQVGHCQNGRAFPSDHYQNDGVPLLRPGNLAANGRVRWTAANTRYLPEHYAQSAADLLVAPSEVVMNLTAQSLKDDFLGRACITGPVERCLLNQRLARLTPFATSSAYALLFFRSPLFRDFVKTLNTGSLIQHMYTHQLDSCWIPLPPKSDQDTVVAECERSLSVVDNLERTVDAAALRGAGLRRSVLKAAFEGQLVEQDPSEHPASSVLQRIQADRTSGVGLSGGRRKKAETS